MIPPRPAPGATPFTFLFVGTLGYFPNYDAVRWFSESVAPLIHARVTAPFRLVVVGPSTAGEFGPEVTCTGWVDDLAGQYAAASAVVVPVRAGGGTRIKILEAFAHRRPVVSTSTGAEGLEAVVGEHFLLADEAADFADACAALMNGDAHADGMIDKAFELVTRRYERSLARDMIRRHSTA